MNPAAKRPRAVVLFFAATAVLLFGLLSRCGLKAAPVNEDLYPAPWQDSMNVRISRALIVNDVSGCGELKYRQSQPDPMAYLVHCSRDGATWRAYLVHTTSGQVDGPYLPTISH